ncbi:MAG: hypothetical protein ACOX0G_02195 [Patescibacteria group bacterium]|jgi:NADPH-dependent 7-cyano-7-deazaguanine reductase QueF
MKFLLLSGGITGTRISIPFEAVCSITGKGFGGEIIIEYHPNKRVLEYVNAEKEIISFISEGQYTVEEIASEVCRRVEVAIKPLYLKVLIDVKRSEAHRPVQVWIEKEKKDE